MITSSRGPQYRNGLYFGPHDSYVAGQLIRLRAVPKRNELMKEGNADNSGRNEIRVARITQNSHPSKSMSPSGKSCR